MSMRVLVPLDGSAFSEGALAMAARIARSTRGELHLVRVHSIAPTAVSPLAGPPYFDDGPHAGLRASMEDRLDELADWWGSGLTPRTALLEGPVVPALIEYARRHDIDLIVSATHGRGGFSRALLGSVADELVRRSGLPVIALRPNAPPSETADRISRIMIPLDSSELAERVIQPATMLAHATGAEIALFYALTPFYLTSGAREPALRVARGMLERDRVAALLQLERIATTLRSRGLIVTIELSTHDDAAIAIVRQAVRAGADLIAMATHGRSGVRRIALGAVGDRVLRSANVPVLLYRPDRKQAPLERKGLARRPSLNRTPNTGRGHGRPE